jgi:hypothetical protein
MGNFWRYVFNTINQHCQKKERERRRELSEKNQGTLK